MESLGQALEISSLGANHNATVGALFCAEGANASAEGNDGANQIASCQNSFAAAAKLAENVKKLGGKGEFMVDEKVAADPRSQNTLAQFEKHFSLRGEDYLQKMVGAHGGLLAFTEMVKEKLGPKKTEELVEAANTSSPEAPAAKTATPTRLRETLRRNLTESDALREALNRKLNQPDGLRAQAGNAHNSAPQTPRNLENLTPLETNGIFPSEDDANRGMTLFEVVHRKYTELKKRIRL